MNEFRTVLERESSELLPLLEGYAAALKSRRLSSVQIRRPTRRETDSDDAITQFCWDVASRIKRHFRTFKTSTYARPDQP
jgi:hypothetical protein